MTPTAPTPPTPAGPPAPPVPAAPPRRRGVSMPAWVACILILLVAGGLGYGAWWLLRPPPKVDLAQYEPARGGNRWVAGTGGGRANRGPNAPNRPFVMPQTQEAVVLTPAGTGSARVNGLQVQFLNTNNKPAVRDLTPRVSTAADNTAVAVRNFAIKDAARRTAAGVTDTQVNDLRKIVVPPAVALSPTDQATLLKAWADVKAANPSNRSTAEKTLLDAMKAIAQSRTQATTALHAAADQIRAVLKPEQIATLQKPPAATTRKG